MFRNILISLVILLVLADWTIAADKIVYLGDTAPLPADDGALVAIFEFKVETEHRLAVFLEGGPVFVGNSSIFDCLPDCLFGEANENEVEEVISTPLENHLGQLNAESVVA